jgi:tetratricopeptide (TPR) repeat protein/AraC-like DNA-binding protein
MYETLLLRSRYRKKPGFVSCNWQKKLLVFILMFTSFSVHAENETRYLEMLAKAKQQLENSPDSAILTATEVFQHTTVDSLRARSAYLLGTAYYYNGLYHLSRGCYEDALQCVYTSVNRSFKSKVLNNLGVIYDMTGNYVQAIDAYLKSADIDQQMGDSSGMMLSWINIALLYINIKQFDQARKYLDRSRGYFESRNDTSSLALWFQNYGKLENDQGHPERSLTFLKKAARLHHTSGNIYEYLNVLITIAGDESTLEHFDIAFKLLKLVEEQSKEKNYTYLITRGRLTLAEAYIRQGNLGKAKETLKGINSSNSRTLGKKAILELAISIDPHHAFFTLNKLRNYSSFLDSLVSSKNAAVVNELHIRYETEKKTDEIQHQQAILLLQKRKLIFAISGLVIALIMSGILFYLYLQLQKSYRHLYLNLKNSSEPYPRMNEYHPLSMKNLPDNNSQESSKQILFTESDTSYAVVSTLKNNKLFLNPSLKLEDLARYFNTNKTYIYKNLKETTEENFNAVLIRLRVEEARRLMQEHPEGGFESVAEQAGFNSRSSYYRAFKSITGLTPGKYYKYLVQDKKVTYPADNNQPDNP